MGGGGDDTNREESGETALGSSRLAQVAGLASDSAATGKGVPSVPTLRLQPNTLLAVWAPVVASFQSLQTRLGRSRSRVVLV